MAEQFKDERGQVEVEQSTGCQVNLAVKLGDSEAKKARDEAVKDVRKKVDMPGFRKGKLPMEMVHKHFGDAVDERWRELVVNQALRFGAELSKVFPWDIEKVKLDKIEFEGGVEAAFTFEREPAIPDVKEFDKPTGEKEAVSDEAIDQRIDLVRTNRSTFEEQDKAVEEDDFVRIDVFSLAGEEPVALFENRQGQVAKNEMPEWMRNALIGKKKDDTIDTVSAPDDTMDMATRANFEPTKCRVVLRSVEKRVAPEEEAFLEALGMESMDKVREAVHSQLDREAEQTHQEKTRVELWKNVLAKYGFDVPQSLLDQEHKRMVQVAVLSMKHANLSDEAIKEKGSEIEASALNEAMANLQRFFLSRKIVADANCSPEDDEINNQAVQMLVEEAMAQGTKPSDSPEVLQAYRNQAFYLLTIKKAEDHLLA